MYVRGVPAANQPSWLVGKRKRGNSPSYPEILANNSNKVKDIKDNG